jgi:hypothetical protein
LKFADLQSDPTISPHEMAIAVLACTERLNFAANKLSDSLTQYQQAFVIMPARSADGSAH